MMTIHGENIADQIAGEDAYGGRGTLNTADVREILDQIHTNLMDGDADDTPLGRAVVAWIEQAAALEAGETESEAA